jgi:hypothetical protein
MYIKYTKTNKFVRGLKRTEVEGKEESMGKSEM